MSRYDYRPRIYRRLRASAVAGPSAIISTWLQRRWRVARYRHESLGRAAILRAAGGGVLRAAAFGHWPGRKCAGGCPLRRC